MKNSTVSAERPKILGFELLYNRENRSAIAKLLGKRRGSLANEAECRDWVLETLNDKIMDAFMETIR